MQTRTRTELLTNAAAHVFAPHRATSRVATAPGGQAHKRNAWTRVGGAYVFCTVGSLVSAAPWRTRSSQVPARARNPRRRRAKHQKQTVPKEPLSSILRPCAVEIRGGLRRTSRVRTSARSHRHMRCPFSPALPPASRNMFAQGVVLCP